MMRKNDIGTTITIDVGQDISTATSVAVRYKKPDGTTGSWAAAVASGDQGVEYNTQSGDLDQAGMWQFQAYIELPTWQGYSSIVQKRVDDSLV